MPRQEALRNFTNHTTIRARQRGVRYETLTRLIDLSDVAIPARRGCVRIFVSRHKIAELAMSGTLSVASLARLNGLHAILAEDGTVVTVMHGLKHRAGRS